MDDVLCHYELGKRLRFLASLADTSARDVRAALWDSGFEGEADAGAYPDPDDYLEEFGKRLGYPITESEWVEARRHAISANTEVLVVAALLKSPFFGLDEEQLGFPEASEGAESTGDSGRDGHYEGIAVGDVGEFMGDYAFEFVHVEDFQDPFGHGDSALGGVAARDRNDRELS